MPSLTNKDFVRGVAYVQDHAWRDPITGFNRQGIMILDWGYSELDDGFVMLGSPYQLFDPNYGGESIVLDVQKIPGIDPLGHLNASQTAVERAARLNSAELHAKSPNI